MTSDRSHLYVAVPQGANRFKVGISVNPEARWHTLAISDLDRTKSFVTAGPKPAICRLEKSIHLGLAQWHMPLETKEDGFSEWFSLEGLGHARALLDLFVVGHSDLQPVHLEAFFNPPKATATASASASNLSRGERIAARIHLARLDLTQSACTALPHWQAWLAVAYEHATGCSRLAGTENFDIWFERLSPAFRVKVAAASDAAFWSNMPTPGGGTRLFTDITTISEVDGTAIVRVGFNGGFAGRLRTAWNGHQDVMPLIDRLDMSAASITTLGASLPSMTPP